jgi:GcrA cell cycle regulator
MGVETWTKEQVDFAIDLWRQGVSGSIIGARLGRSRCSVLGKLHRMKATAARPTRVQRPNSTRIARKERHKKRIAAELAARPVSPLAKLMAEPWTPRQDMPVVPISEQRTLLDLRDDQCRWPMTDAPPHLHCARSPRVPGSSYCEGHLIAAHSNMPPRGMPRPDFSRHLMVNVAKRAAAAGMDPTAHVYPVDARTLEVIE